MHRFAGTVLGLVILAALTPLDPTGAALVVVLAARRWPASRAYLVRNYGLAMCSSRSSRCCSPGSGPRRT
ncbi:hypothetical protein GS889_15430 [Rhodococcus hoagii]|nr:hypothetical protein [Prescottella equi]